MEQNRKKEAAAGSTAPAAFVLHDLKAPDVWQMTRVLRRLDLVKIRDSISDELLKKADFKAPTMYDAEGKLVPLPADQWTDAQKQKAKQAKEAGEELTWQILGLLMENIGACEAEVNKLLAMGCQRDVSEITAMDANVYLDLIVQYVTREGFSDFFTHAAGLLRTAASSRSSIAHVVTYSR